MNIRKPKRKLKAQPGGSVICLRCDGEDFKEVPDADIEQEYKGESLRVIAPALECRMCGWRTVTLKQADELFRRTKDAYELAMLCKDVP